MVIVDLISQELPSFKNSIKKKSFIKDQLWFFGLGRSQSSLEMQRFQLPTRLLCFNMLNWEDTKGWFTQDGNCGSQIVRYLLLNEDNWQMLQIDLTLSLTLHKDLRQSTSHQSAVPCLMTCMEECFNGLQEKVTLPSWTKLDAPHMMPTTSFQSSNDFFCIKTINKGAIQGVANNTFISCNTCTYLK